MPGIANAIQKANIRMGRRPKNPPPKPPMPDNIIIIPSAKDVIATGPPPNESTLERVWRENGVTLQKLVLQPKFEQPLKMIGGVEVAFEYLRGSEDPDALKLLEVFDRVDPKDRDFLGFDGFCVAADVSGRKIWGMIMAESMTTSEQTVRMLTAMKAPEVVANTINMALVPDPDYHNDRKLVAQASGWLPKAKGSQIQINTTAIGGPVGPTITLPSFDQDMRQLSERFQSLDSKSGKLLEGKIDKGEE